MTLLLHAEPVLNVTIRANVSERVEFNSTVVLTCSAEGSFLKFSWTNGTAPIMADNARLAIEEVRLHVYFDPIRFEFGLDCIQEEFD